MQLSCIYEYGSAKFRLAVSDYFMKIAILGKGGSGKSTISWLLVNYLASNKNHVLAIDADHNMDLSANLGYQITAQTPTIHQNHDQFKIYSGMKAGDTWASLANKKESELPRFSFPGQDWFTDQLVTPLSENISLINVGLGQEDVLFSSKCAHGHSAPLKFYLPLLETGSNSQVIIDGVAGVDMVNYGLFIGCDLNIVSLENHANSKRVLDKILVQNTHLGVPTYVVLNKYVSDGSFDELEAEYENIILGKIPNDFSILKYDFANLSEQTKTELALLWEDIQNIKLPESDKWSLIQQFQAKKNQIQNVEN
jgi:CO dehydrogenase maturation factor